MFPCSARKKMTPGFCCRVCFNSVEKPFKSDISKTAQEKKLEDDIVFLGSKLANYRHAFIAIWDSATDVLSQEDTERIQTVNSLDFRTLEIK